MGTAVPTGVVPSAARGWDQIWEGTWQQLPSFFHSSQRSPFPSTNSDGSMEPPRATWHTTGRVDAEW